MQRNKKRKSTRTLKRHQARQRAVDQAAAYHAIDRLSEKRRQIVAEKRQLVETLDRLERQNEEWTRTIKVLKTQVERLDCEIIGLNTQIGEAQAVANS